MSEPFRCFVDSEKLQGDEVLLSGEALHHLATVLRCRVGDGLVLLDGQGLCCQATLESLSRREARAKVTRRWQSAESALPVTLVQALPKGDKLDLVLQKGTELGITTFRPVVCGRSGPAPQEARQANRQRRWRRIIEEACRQCKRDLLPELAPVASLETVLEVLREDALKIALWEQGAVPLSDVLPSRPPEEVVVLVGPEGGFAKEEMTQISSAGFQPVHLGPRILRTETAGLAVTPILQYLYGDWRLRPTADLYT